MMATELWTPDVPRLPWVFQSLLPRQSFRDETSKMSLFFCDASLHSIPLSVRERVEELTESDIACQFETL